MTSQSERMQSNTVTSKVYRRLKADIIDGIFPPGTHLVRRTLAARYGVSPLPVMEACFRLENDGLVENSPMLGTHVVNMSEEIIAEDRKYREALECQAAWYFAETAGELEKQQLKVLAEFLDGIQEKLDPADKPLEAKFAKHHSELHLEIARISGAQVIYRQMRKLWFRRLMIAGDTHAELFPVPSGWHTMLVERLASGDPEAACHAMREHLRRNSDPEQVEDSVKEVLRRGRSELIDRMLIQDDPDI